MNNMNENFEKIEKLIETAKADMTKFVEKGNAAAGTRVRKYMQELRLWHRKFVLIFRM